MKERKEDTRRKIQLGGLIIKAQLQDEAPTVLLGLLIESKESLESKSGNIVRERYRLRGDIAFTK